MRSLLFLGIVMALCVSACTEPIEFSAGGKDLLVVDGFITDELKVQRVRLSRTVSYSGDAVSGLSNAAVSIVNEAGNTICLKHTIDGNYETEVPVAGEAGSTYTLHITTAENEEFISEPQTLLPSGSLDTVYFAQAEKEFINDMKKVEKVKGIQYFIDYSLPADKQTYLMWRWDATYKYRTRYHDRNLPLDCYVEENSTGFFRLVNSADVAQDKVLKEEFMFVVPDSKYWYAYSLNVKQYSISKDVYEFFLAIKKQQENTGTIFDPAPAQIRGNIRNVHAPEEIVLGYFGAFGATDKRTFVYSIDVPNLPSDPDVLDLGLYPECVGNEDDPGQDESVPRYCFDCRRRPRASAEPPAYWE